MNRTEELRKAAWRAHERGDLTAAERLYRQLLTSGADVQDAINLGALLRSQGRYKEAISHYHLWLQRFPEALTLRLNGVNCLLANGEHSTCQQWLEEGLQLHPRHPQLMQSLGKTLIGLKQLTLAQQLLEQQCQTRPREVSLWLDLGLCRHQQGDLQGALAAFEKATWLSPEDPRPAANCILVLKELGELGRAHGLITSLSADLRRHKSVRAALGGLLLNEARMEEAAQELQALCEDHPEDPIHWLNLAAALRSLKKPVACCRALKRGLTLHPQHVDLEQALGQSLAEMGKQEAAMELLLRSSDNEELLPESHLFNLQFLGAGYGLLSSKTRKGMARRWEERKAANGVGPLWGDVIREPIEGRPLRVGYLSADFCNHPVGRFLLPVLKNHDRRSVEVWGLSCGPHEDTTKDAMQQACDHWLDLRIGSDLEASRIIADQGLDLVVELGGFTAHSRLALLAYRPAPVQLSYLGFYAPTYLRAIDGWIGDEALFATLNQCDKEAHPLISLKGGYMGFCCEDLPEIEPPLMSRKFRFGSFNHSRKLTPTTVALWCDVLRAVPDAELALKSISFVEQAERDRVATLFSSEGISTERIIILPWAEGWNKHMACYKEMDIALDPIPYGGATTSCEALAMGIPLVSLAGPGMVGCLSASVLTFGAKGAGLTTNKNDYICQAKAYAKGTPRGVYERQRIREQLMNSPLGNCQRLCRELEKVYKKLTRSSQHR